MAAVEVDFGGGLFERIEIAPNDDPTQVARDFCQAKGFSATIAVPLAVKLEQARDKSRRLERAARQGRPVTAKPVMASTLTEEAKAALKAKEARAKAKARAAAAEAERRRLDSAAAAAARRPASATWEAARRPASSAARPPELRYEKSKQFHSSAEHAFDRTEVVFGKRRPASAGAERLVAGELSDRRAPAYRKYVFGAGPGKQSRVESFAQKEAARLAAKARQKDAPTATDADAPRGGAAVFDKLYANAMRKKEKAEALLKLKEAAQKAADAEARARSTKVMSRASRELMQNRTAGDYASYNERLYAEGAQRAVAREAARARAAEEKAREELEHATGAPQISRYAKSLRRPEAAWDRLGEGYAEKFEVLAQIKEDLERKELSECTFRPKINARSRNLVRGKTDALRDRGLSHHEQLYFDANRRAVRREEYETWRPSDHTFHPNAHRFADGEDDGVDGFSGAPAAFKPPKVRHEEVVRRLEASKVRGDHEKARLEEEAYADLGVPRVGRPPAIDRNPAGLPVHEVLYANRHEYDDKRELIRARDEDRLREAALSAKSSAKTEGLVGALKRRKFRAMFAALDAGDAGSVDLRGADLSRLADVETKRARAKRGADAASDSVYNTPASAAAVSAAATPASNAGRPDLAGFGGVPRAGSLSPGSPGGGDDEARETRLREMVADVRSASAMCAGPVGVEGFIAAMEAVIAHDRTGPRAYLTAGQGRFSGARAGTKAAHAAAAAREQALAEVELGRSSASATRTERLAAARQRKLGVSSATPIYEKLAVEGRFKDMKLRERAAALERQALAECTFAPQTHARSEFEAYASGPRDAAPGAGDAADGVDAKRGHRASRASRGSNLRELEALAGSVAGGRGAARSVAGAERFAAIEKELQALASRAGVGDGSPLSALADPESSDEEETPVTK